MKEYTVKLNEELLKEQFPDEKERNIRRDKIIKLHIELNKILTETEGSRDIALLIEEYEYDLQFEWGFPLNPGYHSYWNKHKDCECPKLDNDFNAFRKVINGNCPLHSEFKSENGENVYD